MADRKPMSKRLRFEVFKRDRFACVYCGAHPPGVLLEVDHVHPVAEGGQDELDNLVTACQPCNAGKGARLLDTAPAPLAERAAEVAEREAQIVGYRAVLDAARARMDEDIDRVAAVFERAWGDQYTLTDTARTSVRRFIEELGVHAVVDAMETARANPSVRHKNLFRYFCGICWRRIRERGE